MPDYEAVRKAVREIIPHKGYDDGSAGPVLVRLAYAIGYNQPVEATAVVDGVAKHIEGYDLSPRGIIDFLRLERPLYEDLATSGHYGRPGLLWDA